MCAECTKLEQRCARAYSSNDVKSRCCDEKASANNGQCSPRGRPFRFCLAQSRKLNRYQWPEYRSATKRKVVLARGFTSRVISNSDQLQARSLAMYLSILHPWPPFPALPLARNCSSLLVTSSSVGACLSDSDLAFLFFFATQRKTHAFDTPKADAVPIKIGM